MDKRLWNPLFLAACCAVLCVAAIPCEKDGVVDGEDSPKGSGSKAAYDAVVKRLDTEGVYLLYQSKKLANERLGNCLNCLERLLSDWFEADGDFKAYTSARAMTRGLCSCVSGSGLTEISGVGMSSLDLGDGRFGNRMFIHHFPEDSTGILWKAFSFNSNAFDAADRIPDTAKIAGACCLNLSALKKWVESFKKNFSGGITDELKKRAGDGLKSVGRKVGKLSGSKLSASLHGFDASEFVSGLNGNLVFFSTCDCEHTARQTFGDFAVEVPKVAFLAAAGVAEGAKGKSFAQLAGLLADTAERVRDDDGNERLLFAANDPRCMFAPLIVEIDGMLVFASNQEILDAFVAARGGDAGNLRSTADFKSLSSGMTDRCGAFFYVSTRLMPDLRSLVDRDVEAYCSARFGAGGGNADEPKENHMSRKDARKVASDVLDLVGNTTILNRNLFTLSTVEVRDDGIMFCSTSGSPWGTSYSPVPLAGWFYNGVYAVALGKIALEVFFDGGGDSGEGSRDGHANLSAIAEALNAYALDHGGRYPAENGARGFSELVEKGYLVDLSVLRKPVAVGEGRGGGGSGGKRVSRLPLTEKMCDYVYIAGLRDDAPKDLPLVFEKPGRGVPVRILLFGGKIIRTRKPASSCRQLLISLKRQFHYPDKLFQALLSRAERYDRLLRTGGSRARRTSPSP